MEKNSEVSAAHFELPSIPEVEKVRQTCSTHGDHYANRLAAALKFNDIIAKVQDETELSEIVANDPELAVLHESTAALDILTDDLRHTSRGLRPLLASNKTSQVNSFVDAAGDKFLAALGRRPDVTEIQLAALFFAMQTAVVNSKLGEKASRGKFESLIVNQFTNSLLAKADTSKLCSRFTRPDDELLAAEAQQQVRAMAELFRAEVGRDVNDDFFTGKILSLRYNLAATINMSRIKERMPASEATEAEVRELSLRNTALMQQIRRIQAYGVKSVTFPFNDVIPDFDAVFHSHRVLGQDVLGDQPMALIQLTPSSLDKS